MHGQLVAPLTKLYVPPRDERHCQVEHMAAILPPHLLGAAGEEHLAGVALAGGFEPPSEDALDAIEQLFRQVEEMQALLRDPAITSVRLVVNPEKMVLAESRRTFTYLNLFGFNTDAIVVNRVLPEGAGSGYFAGWRSIQAHYEEEIRTAFSPLPLLHVPLLETEVVGLLLLERVAAAAFEFCDQVIGSIVLHCLLLLVIQTNRSHLRSRVYVEDFIPNFITEPAEAIVCSRRRDGYQNANPVFDNHRDHHSRSSPPDSESHPLIESPQRR